MQRVVLNGVASSSLHVPVVSLKSWFAMSAMHAFQINLFPSVRLLVLKLHGDDMPEEDGQG